MKENTFAYKAAVEISNFVKNNYKKAANFPSIEFYWTKADGTECSMKYILKEHKMECKGLPTSKFVMNETVIEIGDTVSTINMICGVNFIRYSQRTPWVNGFSETEMTDKYWETQTDAFYTNLHFIFKDNDFEYKSIINK